jgi:uncharacterized protein
MQLENLQMDFSAALVDARLLRAIAPSWAGGERVLDRLALYRGNLLATWQKALSNAYPVVRAIVGADFFTSLVGAYGHTHPSTDGDLNRFGAHLAGFVASFERTRAMPYLADVAALEWTVHRAQHAADATPLSRAYIASLSASALLDATFSVHPAYAWLGSKFPIASIWQAHQSEATVALPNALAPGEYALVARPGWRPVVVASSRGEIAALAALRSGAAMETVIGEALQAEPGFDFSRSLVRWLDLDLLVESGKRAST